MAGRHRRPEPTSPPRYRPIGRPIAYGYLRDRFPLADYQTVFADRPRQRRDAQRRHGLHAELVARLIAARHPDRADHPAHRGVLTGRRRGAATGVVRGAGGDGDAGQRHQAAGGRVIAVGTTVTRALESAVGRDGTVAGADRLDRPVIDPRRPVRVVDGLITGWHNPDASHLLLVEQVAGAELTQRAYDAAVAARYLWHEFGDSGLLLRR